jgi:hypothetical protein
MQTGSIWISSTSLRRGVFAGAALRGRPCVELKISDGGLYLPESRRLFQ